MPNAAAVVCKLVVSLASAPTALDDDAVGVVPDTEDVDRVRTRSRKLPATVGVVGVAATAAAAAAAAAAVGVVLPPINVARDGVGVAGKTRDDDDAEAAAL